MFWNDKEPAFLKCKLNAGNIFRKIEYRTVVKVLTNVDDWFTEHILDFLMTVYVCLCKVLQRRMGSELDG
jgi:hypothetical protein